jgi:hypothetical protein
MVACTPKLSPIGIFLRFPQVSIIFSFSVCLLGNFSLDADCCEFYKSGAGFHCSSLNFDLFSPTCIELRYGEINPVFFSLALKLCYGRSSLPKHSSSPAPSDLWQYLVKGLKIHVLKDLFS